jgi:hypothetical protein
MEFVVLNIDAFEFLVGDLDSFLIGFGVEFGVNLEASRSGCGRDEVDDCLETAQGLSAPVLADVRKEAMLDLVPLSR